MRFFLIITCLFFSGVSAHAQKPKEYNNGHGGKISLPLGDLSFADKVIFYKPGNPPPIRENSRAEDALLSPDFDLQKVKGFVSLGIGGELCLAFTDNALVNIDGPDVYIFEVGRYVEETFLFVSKDAKKWKNVGRISGGNALVDIGDSTLPNEIFTYIKLVDARSSKDKNDRMWPGADIDAVAAIGSAKQIALNALYLFDTNKSVLKAAAKKQLDSIISEFRLSPQFDLVINGHTDSVGSRALNEKLSIDRARSVEFYFVSKMPEMKRRIQSNGYADDLPIAENSTVAGREKNRRVEVFFVPQTKK